MITAFLGRFKAKKPLEKLTIATFY